MVVILDRTRCEVIQNPVAFKDTGCRIKSGMTIFFMHQICGTPL